MSKFEENFQKDYQANLKKKHNIDLNNCDEIESTVIETALLGRDLGIKCRKCFKEFCKLCQSTPFHYLRECWNK